MDDRSIEEVEKTGGLLDGDPDSHLSLLVLIALVSMVLILSLAAAVLHRVYSSHVIDNAEKGAVQVSEAIVVQEYALLLVPGAGERALLTLDASKLRELDRRIKAFLEPFDIIKVKIFTPGGRVVYSTDPTIIGRVDRDNIRLRSALQGGSDSKLETVGAVLDLADEERIDVDVVETYVAIRDRSGKVVGCFEIYQDVTRYRQEIRDGVIRSVLSLALILLAVFSCAFAIVKKGVGRLKAMRQELEVLAKTDALTGLWNRREILARCREEFARCRRCSRQQAVAPLSVIMLDVDRFKSINDTHGHLVGDAVLKGIADRISDALRPYDVIGRYGGEEFLLFLPDTGLEEARAVAERIRRIVREEPFAADGHALQVAISLGGASLEDCDVDVEAVIRRADDALARSKKSGRDRVVWQSDVAAQVG